MKTICLAVFIACLALSAGAQSESKPKSKIKVDFGARAGANSSFMRNNPSGYSVSSQIGFNAGVYARISGIWKRLFIQPGVDYYFNSYKYQRTLPLDNTEDRVNIHTIQIPVTVGYVLVSKSKFYWQVNTGPMISILAGVSDNDVGISRDFYKPVIWSWRTETYLTIGGKLTINVGFDAGMSKLYNDGSNIRPHTWYGGIGFNL